MSARVSKSADLQFSANQLGHGACFCFCLSVTSQLPNLLSLLFLIIQKRASVSTTFPNLLNSIVEHILSTG